MTGRRRSDARDLDQAIAAEVATGRGAAVPGQLLRDRLPSEWQRYLADTPSLQQAEYPTNTVQLTGTHDPPGPGPLPPADRTTGTAQHAGGGQVVVADDHQAA